MNFVSLILFLAVMICGNINLLNAQEFSLRKQDEIKTLDYYANWYIVQKMGDETECCNSRRYLGKIKSISNDSIEIEVSQLQTRRTDMDKSYLSTVKFSQLKEFPTYTIAKSDIKNIQEEKNLTSIFNISGGILLFTSIATGIHGLIVNKESILKEQDLESISSYDLVIIHTPHTSFSKIDFENIKSLIFDTTGSFTITNAERI